MNDKLLTALKTLVAELEFGNQQRPLSLDQEHMGICQAWDDADRLIKDIESHSVDEQCKKASDALTMAWNAVRLCRNMMDIRPMINIDDKFFEVETFIKSIPNRIDISGEVIATVILDNSGGDYSTDYKDLEVNQGALDKLPVGTKVYAVKN